VLLVQRKSRGPGVLLLLAWLLSYPILALANGFVVTFILKHLLYMLPALAILGAVGLDTLSGHRWGRWIAVAVVMLVVWQGLAYEVSHIARFE
jgi:hypothetical protein